MKRCAECDKPLRGWTWYVTVLFGVLSEVCAFCAHKFPVKQQRAKR